MLRSCAGRASALPIDQDAFNRILYPIWKKSGHKPHIGLAISGGVDSMALASLCSRFNSPDSISPAFSAFIVDHGVRKGSTEEAENVAELLRRLKIEPHILKLDWKGFQDPGKSKNFESIARKMRFQSLGRACWNHGIRSLLLAHHGDDQAESVLFRLISGYHGRGLRGVKMESAIPECHGLYGVHESGEPQPGSELIRSTPEGRGGEKPDSLTVEGGGVTVFRPLLDYTKTQLIATCKENQVEWFEDATNADKTLTPRNAIRHLLTSGVLPRALSGDSLRQVSKTVAHRVDATNVAVAQILKLCPISLHTRTGVATVTFPPEIYALLRGANDAMPTEEIQLRAALVLRTALQIVSPQQNINLQDLENATRTAFPRLLQTNPPDPESARPSSATTIAKTSLLRTGHAAVPDALNTHPSPATTPDGGILPTSALTWRIQRQTPSRHELATTRLTLLAAPSHRAASIDPVWTPWQLWDSRYWIRLRYQPFNHAPGHGFSVVFAAAVRKPDMTAPSKDQDQAQAQLRFKARGPYPRSAQRNSKTKTKTKTKLPKPYPAGVLSTLPAIVETWEVVGADGECVVREVVRALPSLGWADAGWCDVEEGLGEADRPWQWEVRFRKVEVGGGGVGVVA